MSPTTFGEVVASNIRAARNRVDISQLRLATRMRYLGFSAWLHQTVGNVEKGKRRVTADEIVGLALALNTTVPRLMTPLGEDKWVQMPSGETLNVEAVAHLVAGVNDGVIQWHGDYPLFIGPVNPAMAAMFAAMAEQAETRMPPVIAAIVTTGDAVLAGRRNDRKPPWTFIAGESEPGESLADTVTREVKEEADLLIGVGDVIGHRVHPQTRRVMVYVAAWPTHGTSVQVGDERELAEVAWLSLAEADARMPDMFPAVHTFLEREIGGG